MRIFALALAAFLLTTTPLLAEEPGPRAPKEACFVNISEDQRIFDFGKDFDSTARKYVNEEAFQKFLKDLYPPKEKVAECVCETGPKCGPTCYASEYAKIKTCNCCKKPCRRCCGGSYSPTDSENVLTMLMLRTLDSPNPKQ
jgi:hypothetical protein